MIIIIIKIELDNCKLNEKKILRFSYQMSSELPYN